jgi:pyruvate dehydrogenase E2 component (dihydrolipoamide acetyltransferase)
MPHEIRVPRLGWSMEEAVFLRWLKNDGDPIQPGDLLYELESDKATQEIEALDAGVLRIPADSPPPETVVPVGALLGYLVSAEEAATGFEPPHDIKALEDDTSAVPAGAASLLTATADDFPGDRKSSRLASTPRARRIAAELNVDWTQLEGSGRGGRVREADVRKAAHSGSRTQHARGRDDSVVAVSRLRRTIAERMLESAKNTAPVTLTMRADAVNLVALKDRLQGTLPHGRGPTYTDMAVCIAAQVLRQHPMLAARWDGDRIVLPPENGFDMCIAVDTDSGLVAPVLRDVNGTSLVPLAERTQDLISRAKSGKLSLDEMQGGVFTVTNLGAYGIEAFTPIINYPQTAILGLGAIRREAVVTEAGGIEAREQMMLSLTFDHRLFDGAPAARFLRDLRSALENPSSLLLGPSGAGERGPSHAPNATQ